MRLKEICEKKLLPKIYVDQPQPTEDTLLTVSVVAKKSGVLPERPIWVITAGGGIKRSDEVYYPEHFKSIHDYVNVFKALNMYFLDLDKYISYDEEWREFFERASVKGLETCRRIYSYHYMHQYMHSDYETIIDKVKGLLEESKDKDKNIRYIRVLKRLYETLRLCWGERKIPVKVLTDDESFADSTQCLLHDDYGPKERWAKWKKKGFNIGPFITQEYISPSDVIHWREFLTEALGVKEEASKEDV